MNKPLLIVAMFTLGVVPSSLSAQNPGRVQLIFLAGVRSYSSDEVDNIYGVGLTGKFAVATPVGGFGRLSFTSDYFSRAGDPFYNSKDFDAGDAARLTLAAVALSYELHGPNRWNPQLYFGAGVDYVFAREKIRGLEDGTGGAIGAHLSVSPEVRLSRHLSLVTQASYRFLEINFKSGRDRYKLNLSGASILIGLGIHL